MPANDCPRPCCHDDVAVVMLHKWTPAVVVAAVVAVVA